MDYNHRRDNARQINEHFHRMAHINMGELGVTSHSDIGWNETNFVTTSDQAEVGPLHGTMDVTVYKKDGKLYFRTRDYIKAVLEGERGDMERLNNIITQNLRSAYNSSVKHLMTHIIYPDEPEFFNIY